jgi:hypothetical protein
VGKRIAIAVLAINAVAFVSSPIASADGNGYIDCRRNNGYMLPLPPGQLGIVRLRHEPTDFTRKPLPQPRVTAS